MARKMQSPQSRRDLLINLVLRHPARDQIPRYRQATRDSLKKLSTHVLREALAVLNSKYSGQEAV